MSGIGDDQVCCVAETEADLFRLMRRRVPVEGAGEEQRADVADEGRAVALADVVRFPHPVDLGVREVRDAAEPAATALLLDHLLP